MRKVCTKMVSKELTDENKLQRVEVCQENFNMCENKEAIVCVAHVGVCSSRKGKNVQIQNKNDAHCLFDIKGIVHHEFVPPGQTVNVQVSYGSAQETQIKGQSGSTKHHSQLEVAPRQRPGLHRLSLEQLPDQGRHPHASATALHPRSGPWTFFLFLCLKRPMKGEDFEATEGIQAACTTALKAIPENAYRDAFNAWKLRWQY
ncbi:hypothetical protein QYM36_018182 [Artemia franciscana]|uniref:Uncharacterized protein n=1 Tax=Artemia franciscana TaxID=6661 RepID=A0AA88KU82_ARTSF|nr:hypothetical protein QYM36_018182 [Artemia franciscana]